MNVLRRDCYYATPNTLLKSTRSLGAANVGLGFTRYISSCNGAIISNINCSMMAVLFVEVLTIICLAHAGY